MMPGDNQSKTVAIAADATVGDCQNCSVLHQSLSEYVSSFLALKQKIAVTDESIRLRQQVEELQITLFTLEKKTVNYESVQAELEEKKIALIGHEQMLEEMDKLKQENNTTSAEIKKLEDQLKDMKELTETQSAENAQLRREKAVVENDLLKTLTSLKKYEAQADQVEKLKEENSKTTNLNIQLENKVQLLEDSICKQNHQISQLTKEKMLLERNTHDLQVRLMKLERKCNKDYRSTSSQTNIPEEPKVDKDKIRILLQSLWACVEPQQQDFANLLQLAEPSSNQVLPSSPQNRSHSHLSNTSEAASQRICESNNLPKQLKPTCAKLNPSAPGLEAVNHQAGVRSKRAKKQTDTPKKSKHLSKELKAEESSTNSDSTNLPIEQIMDLFKPMLPLISPLPDSDTEMESLEPDDGQEENHPNPSDVSIRLQQEEPLLFTTSVSSHCPKTLTTETTVELPAVTAQHISNGNYLKDFGQNVMSEMKDKSSNGENLHLKKDVQTELNPATVHSASASSSSTSGIHIPDKNTEIHEPRCSVNAPGISETGTFFGKTQKDQADADTKMDVDTNPGDVTVAKVVAPDNNSPRKTGPTAISEEAGDVRPLTSSSYVDSVRNTEVQNAENSSEFGKRHQNSSGLGRGSQDETVFRAQKEECSSKDTDMAEDVEELPENNAQSTGSVTVTASPSQSNLPMTSDGESPADQANVETPSKKDANIETLNSEIVADIGSQKTFYCESLKENTHSPYRGLSPPCLDPTVELQKVPEKCNAAVNLELISNAAKVSPCGSNSDERTPSPHKPPPLMVDNSESHADREPGQAKVETPSKHDVDKETLSGDIRADCGPCPKMENEKSESLDKKMHSVCRRLSPSCLYPTVKLDTLEAPANPKKRNAGVTTEPNLEPHDSTDTSSCKVSKCELGSVSPSTSLRQSAVATDGQNTSSEAHGNSPEKQSPHMTRKEAPSPEADSMSDQPAECLDQYRFEMGPPLPHPLTPLSTPPKVGKSINPSQAIGKLSFPSPLDRLASPTTPVKTQLTPNSHRLSSSLNSPLPNEVPSSPLQFGSATPKHAVPVPGRLPLTAMNSSQSSSSSPCQENSMRILDSMYPELSAHARTLSILRGNVNLGVCSSESGTLPTSAVSRMSGCKTITSTSTAFTKTEMRGGKRQLAGLPQSKNRKCLRLDNCSPPSSSEQAPSPSPNSADEITSPQTSQTDSKSTAPSTEAGLPEEQNLILSCLKKIESQCFDLLAVIQSHLYVGNLPKKPVLRDEEKEVISEIGQSSLINADDMLFAILNKLKTEKRDLSRNYMQALCRVYTGICRQKGDWEKAHILAHSILTQDFPDSPKLILFMVTTWSKVLSHSSSLCQAIHAVTKVRAEENLVSCLSVFLGWEKSPPCDIDELISRTLSDVRSGSGLSFTKHSRYGDDLDTKAWEHVFTLHLLCSQKKWNWTYKNVLDKELWPLMNTWVTQPRDQQTPVSDATVATVLRLIGRLGQLGIKERSIPYVLSVANVINVFGRRGQSEGVPWEVQLAAIYCIYDLSPCNPKQALDALAGWRGETSQSVPAAVTSCINQLASICRQMNN